MRGIYEKKYTISIIALIMIIVLIAAGTYAWLSWRSANNTTIDITVAGGRLLIYGGGDITSNKKIAPTSQCNHPKYGIQRTITAEATNETITNMSAYIQINPSIFPTVYKNENIEWAISKSSTDCSSSSNVIASGKFSDVTQGTKFTLTTFEVPAQASSIKKTYYLYIWINETYNAENIGEEIVNSIQSSTFKLQLAGELTNNPNA